MAHLKKEHVSQTAELLRKVILTKLSTLSSKSFDQKSIQEFSLTFRVFVMKYLRLNYEFTDEELPKELDNKNIRQELKDRIIRLSNKLEEIKYAEKNISKAEFRRILQEGISIVDTATNPEGKMSDSFAPEELKRKDPRHLGFYSRLKSALFGARKHHEGPKGSGKRLKKIDNMIRLVREKEALLKAKKKQLEKERQVDELSDGLVSRKKERLLKYDIERRIIGTGVDGLVSLIDDRGKITLADAAKGLEINHEIIQEWINILSEQGIITVRKTGVDTILMSKKVAEKEGSDSENVAAPAEIKYHDGKKGLFGLVRGRFRHKDADAQMAGETEFAGKENAEPLDNALQKGAGNVVGSITSFGSDDEVKEEVLSSDQAAEIKNEENEKPERAEKLEADSIKETLDFIKSGKSSRRARRKPKKSKAGKKRNSKSKTETEDSGAANQPIYGPLQGQSGIVEQDAQIKPRETEFELGKQTAEADHGNEDETSQGDVLKDISRQEDQLTEKIYQESLNGYEGKQEKTEVMGAYQEKDETAGKKDVRQESTEAQINQSGAKEEENVKNEQFSEYYQQVHTLILVVGKRLNDNDLAGAKETYDEMRAHYTQLSQDEKKRIYKELLELYSKLQSKMKKWEIA